MRTLLWTAVAGCLACLLSSCAVTATDDPRPTGPAPGVEPGQARERLAELVVAPRGSISGYDRDRFPHWSAVSGNCNTRETVLRRDGEDVRAGADCSPTSGEWTSPYDGATWTDPSDVDIDHLVPLAQGWVSGARSWTDERRERFANDLDRPQLKAVTDNVNQSKSDQAPDEWKPPLEAQWCAYSSDWIVVKHHYQLTITTAEREALTQMLDRC
ncbi:uncharacterized protein DUF1524 [Amycolatopsis cihanbeyliensis]|uniref:Uncharacterized protein DUF1524 n=1 Tax=Amycolatopsis cihanbeyliensis TaxID=1128664 RepID=A0A542DC92_AMYCI|nr:HNH endonuclease family protein [Amycolatopsis cihanbeyliensis]TQJ00690.1 uncharacterized protein DUF1524 [Amycolatopsis cihanbeyliensis]